MKLDRRYVTIAQELARQLNELGPNTLLPTENDLAAEFGVSRMTVRAALHMLEQNGSVTRVRGRGTIANPRKIVRNAFPMTTIEQDFRQQGIAFDTDILEFKRSSAPPAAIRTALHLSSSANVGHVRLIRRVKGRIICYEDRYVIASLARRLTPDALVKHDVLAFLSFLNGSTPITVEFDFDICPAGQEAAEALGITPGTTIVTNNFVHIAENGAPFESGSISYRIDHCKFRAIGRLTLSFENGDAASPNTRKASARKQQ